MNVTIIYGTAEKANTYYYVQLLLNSLMLNMNIEVTEFLLPKDLPSFNRGCFSCLRNGEERQLHSNYLDSILKSLNDSDLIILASPVVLCDITPDLKSFLELLYCHYIQNRENYSFDNKIGLVMSITAGAGLFHTIKTLKKYFNFAGIKNVLSFSETIYEMNLDYVSLKINKQINEKISKLSNKITYLYNKLHSKKEPFFNKITFLQNKSKFKNYDSNVVNLEYRKNHACLPTKNLQ